MHILSLYVMSTGDAALLFEYWAVMGGWEHMKTEGLEVHEIRRYVKSLEKKNNHTSVFLPVRVIDV